MWGRYRRWAASSQAFLVLAVLSVISAELDYGRGAKKTAAVFLVLAVALGFRGGQRWRAERRNRRAPKP